MKRTLALLLCMVVLVGLLAGCGSSNNTASTAPAADAAPAADSAAQTDSTAAEPEYVFKLANTAPAQGVQADGYNKLKELIEEYSNGRIRVDIYFAGSLAEKTASLEGLQLGTIELTELAATDLSTYNPIWDVFALPYFFDYPMQAVEVANDPDVAAVLDADAEENGFVILSWLTFGARNVFNTKHPINTIDDMKGLKIRVMSSPTLISCMEALGANPISLAWTECYAGMEQGTIDAIENANSLVLSNGFPELGGYYALTQHFVVPDPILISKAVYDALPADLQEAVIKAGKDAEDYWNYTLWDQYDDVALQEMKDMGIEVTEPDLAPFFEAAQASIDSAVSSWNDEQVALYDLFVAAKAKYQNG